MSLKSFKERFKPQPAGSPEPQPAPAQEHHFIPVRRDESKPAESAAKAAAATVDLQPVVPIPQKYDMVQCPRCHAKQKADRDSCYACRVPFITG